MLQNAYFVAKIGADTSENEQHFAEILATDALWRRRRAAPAASSVDAEALAEALAEANRTIEEHEKVPARALSQN